jgi:hypothetical protein
MQPPVITEYKGDTLKYALVADTNSITGNYHGDFVVIFSAKRAFVCQGKFAFFTSIGIIAPVN